ncbi:tetratricopeptide repeat protein [Kitasatospora sp. NPDC101235]|uniref:tetratricopeptide repeat protein n=1 Tax=Kitasatospora sp. NPDC101235 TaxID=3364101 RepID=UPI00381D2CFC
MGERGRQAEALDVLAPFLATGWWTATVTAAELLEGWGRIEEAIEVTRARMALGHPMALESYARLLARHGRAEEAFTLLVPHVDDGCLAHALVDIAQDAGRDEEAAVLLAARIPAGHRCDSPWCCRGLDSDTAIGLLATIRERQGRVDEAVSLLRNRSITSVNGCDQLADLLARHGRIAELRACATADTYGHAAQRLAELLEERGDVEGAIAVYQPGDRPAPQGANSAYRFARLLARHGRGGEAIDVMRAQADAYPRDDWILHALADLCLGQGRPRDGLAHLDDLKARRGGEEEWELFWMRLPLIAASAGVDEAVEAARAHPKGDTWYAAEHIAELLADAGRTEEAVAALQRHAPADCHALAGYLIDLGRVDDAVAVLQQNGSRPPQPATGPWHDEPPF